VGDLGKGRKWEVCNVYLSCVFSGRCGKRKWLDGVIGAKRIEYGRITYIIMAMMARAMNV
jgi:hypothetical protein